MNAHSLVLVLHFAFWFPSAGLGSALLFVAFSRSSSNIRRAQSLCWLTCAAGGVSLLWTKGEVKKGGK